MVRLGASPSACFVTSQTSDFHTTVKYGLRRTLTNIEIMRTFVRVRELAITHQDLAKRLTELELKTEGLEISHDTFSRNTRNQLKQVFDAIRELMTPPESPKRPIGFVPLEDKKNAPKGSSGVRSKKA